MTESRVVAPDADRTPVRPLVAAALALAGAAAMALLARGLAGDEEAAHYLIARHAFAQPTLFLSEVGRPLVTLALCVPAQLGLLGARLGSVLAVGLTAWLTARAAQRTGWIAPEWAALFLLLQPFYLAHAGTAMTEPWAALLVAGGLAAFADRRPGPLAAAGALLPLARVEMVVFWPLIAAALWKERRRPWIAVLPLGMLAWNLLGAAATGDPLYLLHLDPRVYPAREPLLYARSFVWVLGWGLFVPVLLGLLRAVARGARRRRSGTAPAAGARRDRLLVASALLVLLSFALYTYLAVWRPLTFGNFRYLAYYAPAFALLAAAGVEALRRARGPAVWAGLALAAAGAVLLWGQEVHEGSDLLARRSWIPALVVAIWAGLAAAPRRARAVAPALAVVLAVAGLAVQHRGTLHLTPNAEQRGVAAAAALVDAEALGDRPVVSAHPLLAYYLGRNPYDRDVWPPVTASLRETAAPGTLWFWESHYTPRPGAGFEASSLRGDPRWRYLGGAVAPDSIWAGAFFLRTAPGGAASETVPVARGVAREAWFAAADYAASGAAYAARAAAADPGDAERWRVLADRLAASGRLDEARRALARAEEASPGDPLNLAIEAAMLMDEGRTAEAETAARRAFEGRPGDPYVRYLYGRILWEQGRGDEAAPLVLGAAGELPDRWDARLTAGAVALARGDEPAARRHYEAALDLNPGLVIAHFRLAQLALRAGDPGLGIRHLQAVIGLQPTSPRAYVLLGELYQRLGRPEEARAVWRDGLARTGGDSTLAERLRAAP